MRHIRYLIIALGLGVAFQSPAQATETFSTCTGFIDTLPATIGTQGTWCLRQHLSTAMTSGGAVNITVNNVTIDCNGFKIGGLAGGLSTTAYGIAAASRQNTTVRNCNIRGFFHGIRFTGTDSGGGLVENNQLDGNTSTGIWMQGDDMQVNRNRVRTTGGATTSGQAIGIRLEGNGDVQDNLVSDVAAGNGNAFGILTIGQTEGTISDNRVRRLVPTSGAFAYGIYNNFHAYISITGNHLAQLGATSTGLRCQNSSARARGNIIAGYDTPIDTCSGSDNEIVP